MARVKGVPPRGLFQRMVYWMVKRSLGRVPEPMKVAAHSRHAFRGRIGMERAIMKFRSIPASLVSLVHIRVAMHVGCPF
ncbi:hypothetical protein OAU50_05355 [Planctomycetota bacterium]|nr:hypothetical protein [Planctomycetota bacterium]